MRYLNVFAIVLSFMCCSVLVSAQDEVRSVSYPDISKPAASTMQGNHDVAIVVAVEEYQSLPAVHGAEESALDWKSFYREQLGVPNERVHMLRGRDVRPDDIRDVIKKGVEQASSKGKLWFVFIGHGAPYVKGEEVDGLLVGQVARNKRYTQFVRDSIRISEVESLLKKGDQSETVVMIDACFSGRTSSGENLTETMAVLPEALRYTSPIVFTASSQDSVAKLLPGSKTPRPAFSYAMLGALRGWADQNDDEEVSVEEAHAYVERVLLGVQTPQLYVKGKKRKIGLVSNAREDEPGLREIVAMKMSTEESSTQESERGGSSEVKSAPDAATTLPEPESEDVFVLDLLKMDGYICGLMKEGNSVNCWGPNTWLSDLGEDLPVPELMEWDEGGEFKGVKGVYISPDSESSCITYLKGDKTLFCTGGPLTGVQSDDRLRSQEIEHVYIGQEYVCVLSPKGRMSCFQEVGEESPTLETVHVLKDVMDVSIGDGFLCALKRNGLVYCKGANDRGQLGMGHLKSPHSTKKKKFHRVRGVRKVKSLFASYSGTCAVTKGGEVKCWGEYEDGSPASSVAKMIDGLDDIRHVSVEYAIKNNGRVVELSGSHKEIEGLEHAVKIADDGELYEQACALLKTGEVMCWGSNNSGFLGNGSAVESSEEAVYVQGIVNAKDIMVNIGFACALLETGQVMCWGAGWRGGMGRGSESKGVNPTPVQVMF